MTTDVLLALFACGLYAAATSLALAHMHAPVPTRGRDMMMVATLGAGCLVAALLLHALRMGQFPVFGSLEAASWYGLAVTLAYLYVGVRHEVLRTVSAVVFPLVAIVLALGALLARDGCATAMPSYSAVLAAHVAAAFVGYGLFTLVALLGVAYLVQDRNLKHKHLGPLAARLPSLETLDRVIRELIGIAFVLFSASLAMGVLLAHLYHWAGSWTTDPKVLTTFAAWSIYAALFAMCRSGRHGRRLAFIAVVGFAALLVAFVGVHLVTHSVHSFGFPNP